MKVYGQSEFFNFFRFTLLFYCLNFSLCFSQSKALKSALESAYEFEKTENYAEAKKVFSQIQNNPNLDNFENLFIKNYNLFYDYLLSDGSNISNVDKAINYFSSLQNRKPHETELLLNFFSSKYHFEANESWEKSLQVAIQGYELKDFARAKLATRTDYLYDLGYLYDKVGNSFEGIKFYKKSLALYIKQNGENNTEVALNYNNLAYAYTNVYNQKNTIFYY
jgi:hypothetical protein